MRKIGLLTTILILSFMLSAWSPAPTLQSSPSSFAPSATTIPFFFENKTGGKVTITVQGPLYYSFTLKTGKTKTNISPGLYQYSYTACGKQNRGTLTAKNGAKFVLPTCITKGLVKIVIKNNTGGILTLNLTGPATYNFTLSPGKQTISVIKGVYKYLARGCGGATKSGSKNLKSGTTWIWWCN